MMKRLLLVTALFALPEAAFAQQSTGTAEEAKAMLLKAAAAVRADKEVALAQFNKGEGGFRDRDLYVFCYRLTDGKTVAGPLAVPAGTDAKASKDPTGRPFGKEMYDAMQQKPEGVITEVGYLFPKPGTTSPALPKASFVMRVAPDLGCGVGYYK
jgi:hypothetical protein